MIFDTHAHYDDEAFSEDRDEILSGMEKKGIGRIVNVSSSLASIKRTVELTEKYPFIYGAVGIHPSDSGELTEDDTVFIREQAKKEKICAIGEIGLDYHWPEPERDIQKKWFVKQLDLARELDMPVIIHSRDAADDTLKIMKEKASDLRGVIHCFSYGKEIGAEYLKMGYYFGIGGVLTFKNAKKLREVVEFVPMDRLVLETDCPYLSPEPYRGKRNSSLHLPYVAEAIARIKGISIDEVCETTWKNAMNLYDMEK